MRVRIQHVTTYEYDEAVVLGPHTLRLAPAPHIADSVLTYNLSVEPLPHIRWQTDAWGNRLARLTFTEHDPDLRSLTFRVDASFDLQPRNPFDFFLDARVRELPFDYPDGWAQELAPFLRTDDIADDVRAFAASHPPKGHVVDWLVELNRRVASEIDYVIRMEPGIQTPSETLAARRGSCRDSAWLLVHLARASGLAARFVSGYLIQLEDEGDIPGLARGMERDVLDLHAWCEVFVPGAGWIGLDGTSGLLCSEGHVPLATAVVPELAAPISGTASRAASGFAFDMTVERIGHEPRPRKPYSDAQWRDLLAAADHADAELKRRGLSLTVGGEPTWTSRETPDAPEWNTEAMGPTKWNQALRFTSHILDRVGPGAVAMHRFGKQYPGESLPRWALHIMWRRDGVPLWGDATRLEFSGVAAERPPMEMAADGVPGDSATVDAARDLCRAIARNLGVDTEPIPVFEDPLALAKTEADLPPDIDPAEISVDMSEERRRLAAALERGVGVPRGFVVPVQAQQGRWMTGVWAVRRDRVYLIPGDSPIGLRLPLDRLAGVPSYVAPVDPMGLGRRFDHDPRARVIVAQQPGGEHDEPAADVAPPTNTVHTAMAVEVRSGVLHVFTPPVPGVEEYIEFLAATEAAAAELDVAVRVEGYAPPSDPRVMSITVTPDPGVIEVNIPPCESTRDYADVLSMLQDAARHAGLWCEKFQLDGRATGTGGGNHVTLGGPVPAESPFLRQPELLARLVRFFQHHPSLSYLFTGLFVGPTCQAPRVDEGRLDALWELELALSQLDRAGDPPAPWFVDRLLRNLLVDLTGNTHRAEICIDKLFNPSSPTGRLGIVELRGFEMPPHERMAVAQVALVRAIVAALASGPWDAPLRTFGPALHDRYMLPYYLWRDLEDVLRFVADRGVPLPVEGYRPFLDYRFPLFGELVADGVVLQVRQALEPWPVLGEEPTGATVSRYVDSSLERIEIRTHQMDPERYAVAVNGTLLPMTPIDQVGGFVAGVRFRAWQPPHCLHPHIGIHHPLHIDLVDTWAERSVAGCAYHVWHHEGRAFTEPPLTEFEARARRRARFTRGRHLPHPVRLAEPPRHPGFSVTTDLRWTGYDRPMPSTTGPGDDDLS